MCICTCVFVNKSTMTSEARKGGQIPLDLEFQAVVSHSIWTLGLKLSEAILLSRSL